jgi:structural maintenance of chromosome 1
VVSLLPTRRHCCAPALTGVYGRVSELVRVTNRRYNLAMAVVMQQHLDAVVVENRAAGFACVDFLKASKCA